MKKMAMGLFLAFGVASCATPPVVEVDQVGDESMNCEQLAGRDRRREPHSSRRRCHDRGVTGTNVAAAVLFWPALVGTYMNTDEAIKAATERQERLKALYRDKHCT